MITLYIKPNCPYSRKAIDALKEYGVQYVEKNIKDPSVASELIEHGGKRQVPFLQDDSMTPYLIDDDVELYESDAIVEYIKDTYGAPREATSAKKNNLHVMDDNTCDACE